MINEYPDLTSAMLDAIAVCMDDAIRDRLHGDLAPCEPGVFLTAYLAADPGFPIHQFRTAS
jgi:hypothetical protein